MGDRGEDMQQKRTTGRIQTRVAAIRADPIWYALDSGHETSSEPLGGISSYENTVLALLQLKIK